MKFDDEDQRSMLEALGCAATVALAGGGTAPIYVQQHLERQVAYSGGEVEVIPPWLLAAAADVDDHGIVGDQDSGTLITVDGTAWRVLSVEQRRDGFCVLLVGDRA